MIRRTVTAFSRILPRQRPHLQVALPRLVAARQFSDSAPILPGINKGKTSTGLVGLAVEPEWYDNIMEKFGALLDKMEESDLPETAQYRIDVTKWCNYVIAQAKANPEDPEAVEDAVRMGQVEELIEMAEDEMVAMEVYLKRRMWEYVDTPEIVFDPDPMQDPMGPDADPKTAEKIRKGVEAMAQEK